MASRFGAGMRDHRVMRWLFLHLLFAASAAAADVAGEAKDLPVAVSVVGCADDTHPQSTLSPDLLRIQGLLPGHKYDFDLIEHGIDVRIADADEPALWLNSEPWGYSREPIRAIASAEGSVSIQIEVAKQFTWRRLALSVKCAGHESEADDVFPIRVALARELSRVIATGDPSSAMRGTWHAARLLWWNPHSSADRVWTLFQLAALANWGGQTSEEARWLERAIDVADDQGDAVRATLASIWLGGALLRSGDAAADATYLDANQRARQLGQPDLVARSRHGYCITLRTRGRAEEAAACYLETIRAFAEIGDLVYEESSRRARATALLYVGRYREARDEIERAIQLAERSGDELSLARTLPIRAQVARWDGEFERALSLLESGLTLHRRLGRTVDIERAESQIALTYELAQEPARAELFYRSALASAGARGDRFAAASLEVSLAVLISGRGEFQPAIRLLERATSVLAEEADATMYANGMLHKATIEAANGDRSAARATLKSLASAAPSMIWRNRVRLESLQLRLDDAPSGFDAEASLLPMATRALESGDLMLFLELAEALLHDRERRGDRDGVRQLAELALARGIEVASKVRSPMLRNSVLTKLKLFAAAPLWLIKEGVVEPEVARASLSWLERLREAEQQAPLFAMADDSLVELERALSDLGSAAATESPERERLLLRLLSESASSDRSGGRPTPAADDSTFAWDGPDEGALLYLVIAGSRAGALTRDLQGWRWHSDLDASAIRSQTRALQAGLASGHASRKELDQQLNTLVEALRWNELFTRAPESLSVVHDGEITGLPWGMLPSPGNAGRQLVESTRLVTLQSLRPATLMPYSRVHAVVASAPDAAGLPELAQASRELQRVLDHWPKMPSSTSSRADRRDLDDALGDPDALVHIAAHGRGDHGRVEDAGLWLVDDSGNPDFVSALRLRRTPVSAGLIVLGACETGASASGRSLGVGGVAGSLIDAGADAVVGTRWPVSDRVALAFADAFHAALALRPSQPEAALQEAVNNVRRSTRGRHPTHWAGWFLVRRGPSGSDEAAAQ